MAAHQQGHGIYKWQHYLPIYEHHFHRFKDREVHVVEIGVYSGGSLEMWRDYFGPKAHIYGIDINEDCRSLASTGIKIFIGDQADPSFWRTFAQAVPNIDIVVDDGGHESFQQIATLESLLPLIRPGGVYLCEDISGEFNPFLDYLFGLSRELHSWPTGQKHWKALSPTVFQQAIDSFHFYPFASVIEKRSSRIDQLISLRSGTQWQPQTFWEAQSASRPH